MELPFNIIAEPPSRAEILRVLRRSWVLAISAGILTAGLLVVLLSLTPEDGAGPATATLRVVSAPSGGQVAVDGHQRGRTPLELVLAAGRHRVVVQQEGYADAIYDTVLDADHTVRIEADLWLRVPQVIRLRPVFPGASIAGAGFLIDGRVALTVALAPGNERQAWVVDAPGSFRRVGPTAAHGGIAVSPDGDQVAYLASSQPVHATARRLDELWLASSGGEWSRRRYALPAAARDERLVDLSWAPDGQSLLLASRQALAGGGQRTVIRRVEAGGGGPAELLGLPSEIVAGSYSWSPDGERVAFITRSGQLTSLCLLQVASGAFRYLTDLSRDDASPLPFPPMGWSPDGTRLVYAAPAQERSGGGWLFGPKPAPALFLTGIHGSVGEQLGKAEGQSPAWLADDSISAFARPNSTGPLVLRQVGLGGSFRDVAELPLKPASAFAVRWDIAHAQALVAVRGSTGVGGGQPEYWLVRFRPEAGS